MRPLLSASCSLLASSLLLVACNAQTQPPLATPGGLPIIAGASPDVSPNTQPPDAALIAVARAGVDVVTLLGPAMSSIHGLVESVRAQRVKHPPQAAYALAQLSDWTYLAGWWSQNAPDGKRSLRVTFDDVAGKIAGWDVTREDNYAADLHAAFPTGVVRTRLEIDQALSSGGRLLVSLYAPLGESGQTVNASGTGSLASAGAVGSMNIQALTAKLGTDGTVESGEVVLRSLGSGATLQFTSHFDQAGISGTAKLLRSANEAAEVYRDTNGRFLLKNETGTYGM